jgi:hypothetical protein
MRSLSRKREEENAGILSALSPLAILTCYGRWCCRRPIKVPRKGWSILRKHTILDLNQEGCRFIYCYHIFF